MSQRLWIVNHYAAGPEATGSTRHFDLAREIARVGWDVTIFASSFDHQTHREMHLSQGEWVSEQLCEGVRFVWLRTLPYYRNDWRRVLNMFSLVPPVMRAGWNREAPEVIIGSSLHPFAAWAALQLAKRHRARFIFEVRDLWPQSLVDLGGVSPSSPVVRALGWLERHLYEQAETIISLLPRAADHITKLGIPNDKIVHIPNGVDLRRYQEPLPTLPPDVEDKLGVRKDRFVAVYAGAHGLANHLETLLGTAKLVQERGADSIEFWFVGNGPEKRRLVETAQEEGILNVRFLDSMDKRYIPSLLARADVSLLSMAPASLYQYGISMNKIYDYMAAGLPIVMTGTAEGNPVEEGGCGVVLPADDVEGMASTIMNLAASPEKVGELSDRCLRYVERYSTQSLALRLLGVLAGSSRTTATES